MLTSSAFLNDLIELYAQGFEILGQPDRLRILLYQLDASYRVAELHQLTGLSRDRFETALNELVRRGIVAQYDGELQLERAFRERFEPAIRLAINQ